MRAAGAALQADVVVDPCPACGNSRFTVARNVSSPVICDVLRCRDCGLLRRQTLLAELSGRARLGRKLYRDFEAIEERVAGARQRLWKDIFPRLEPYRKTNRMLDIGSARGHFLVAAGQAGWDVEGIEPSEEDSRYAREKLGVRVRAGVFAPGLFPAGHFDVVTLWNVLDHFLEPREALAQMRRLLCPGGVLALRIPNGPLHLLAHHCFRLFGSKDLSVFHNYAFGPAALRAILSAAGFSECRVFNSVASLGDPYRLFGRLGGATVDGVKRIVFFLSQSLYYASAGRILAAPSYLALCRKDEPC